MTLFGCGNSKVFARVNCNQLYVNYQQNRREKRKQAKYHEIAEFVGKKSVLCVQYSQRRVFVGGNNKVVRVWDLSPSSTSRSASESASSASPAQKRHAQTHSTKSKGLQLSGHSGSVTCMQVDGSRVITGSSDKTMRIWTLNSGKPAVATFMGHSKPLSSLRASQRCLASGAANGTVRLWDIEATIPVATLKEHSRSITGLSLWGDDRLLVSSSADGTIRVWDTKSNDKRAVRVMGDNHYKVLALDVDLHLGRVVSGGSDGVLRVWSISNGKCEKSDRITTGGGGSGSGSGSGGTTSNFDGGSGSSGSSANAITQIQVHNQLVLCGTGDGQILWWDPYSGASLSQVIDRSTAAASATAAAPIRGMHEAENVLVYGAEKVVKVFSVLK
jgi:WD40 repeat protein